MTQNWTVGFQSLITSLAKSHLCGYLSGWHVLIQFKVLQFLILHVFETMALKVYDWVYQKLHLRHYNPGPGIIKALSVLNKVHLNCPLKFISSCIFTAVSMPLSKCTHSCLNFSYISDGSLKLSKSDFNTPFPAVIGQFRTESYFKTGYNFFLHSHLDRS